MDNETLLTLIEAVKHKTAIDLLRLKVTSQMREGKTTCTLNEDDIKEVLFVAGMGIDKELEVM